MATEHHFIHAFAYDGRLWSPQDQHLCYLLQTKIKKRGLLTGQPTIKQKQLPKPRKKRD